MLDSRTQSKLEIWLRQKDFTFKLLKVILATITAPLSVCSCHDCFFSQHAAAEAGTQRSCNLFFRSPNLHHGLSASALPILPPKLQMRLVPIH